MSATPPTDPPERSVEPPGGVASGLADDPAFARAVRLAASIFRVPGAFVAWGNPREARLVASQGWVAEAVLNDPIFTSAALFRPAAFVLPDAGADARLAGCKLVASPANVQAFAGVPICWPEGGQAGTLGVLDTSPREFSDEEISLLEELAAGAMEAASLRWTSERIATDLGARVQQRTEALAEAESRYRSIFEHAVEGIYQIKPGGAFLSVNPALARLFGYPSPAVLLAAVPDPSRLYVRPDERTEFEACMGREGFVANREVEVFRSDGTRIWLSENAHVVRDAAGRLVRYEGTVNDITARRSAEEALQRAHEQLEDRVHERTAELALLNGDLLAQVQERQQAEEAARRSEAKFRTLLENAQDLISIFSPEGILLYASPSLQHILGYRPEEMVGSSLFDGHLHPDDRASAAQRLARPLQADGSYLRSEVRMRHRDGHWRTLESISSPLPEDYPVVGIVVNSRDITERRRNEREVEARARQQTAVAELSRHALRGVDLPTFFSHATELVARTLGVDRTGVGELLPGGERALIRAGFGFPAGVVGQVSVENWGAGGDDERPLLVPDLRKVVDYSRLPSVGPAAISAACAAIHDGDRPFGSLAAMSTQPREFTPEEQVFLQTVADLLSTVIQSRRHQTALREAEARVQRIVANTPGMVFQLVRHPDGTHTIPFVSEGSRQVFEVEPTQACAYAGYFGRLIHPDDIESLRQAMSASAADLTPCSWAGRVCLPSGAVRSLAIRMRPEKQGNGDVVWDGMASDVSELKRTEDALRVAKEEAERANNAKSEFLSRMSHELRTPLNAILGFGQLLQLENLTPIQTTSVEQIVTGGRHLLDLINEILDIARIEAGDAEMNPERLDLPEAVGGTLRFVGPLAQQHRVRLEHRCQAPSGPCVWADRGRFNQVLLNLLSNAIKYNRPGGRVRVACRRLAGDRARVSVTDTGPGLDPEEIARLFTPFQRLKAPERGIAGTGIGLTITKALVEAMGGTVGVRSSPGRGSRFHFDLPVLAADPLPSGDTDVHAPPASAVLALNQPPPVKTVLHIDDQAANAALIERVLGTRLDLRLLVATDGRGGLDLARTEQPDLILLDLHLPDLGGDEVMRRLQADPHTRDIAVVVLSADATPRQIARLRQLGVRDYLTKPFKIDTLVRAVEEALASPVLSSAS